MKRTNLFLLILALVAVLLSACGSKPATTTKINPVTLEEIEGTKLKRVILTEKAAQRIDVKTVSVSGKQVPYAAVIYDTDGNTWVYTNPAPLTFVRAQVVIDRIEGDRVFLSQALESNDPIVTVGVAEIYGAETGVSK